jgi:hypothetical protein
VISNCALATRDLTSQISQENPGIPDLISSMWDAEQERGGSPSSQADRESLEMETHTQDEESYEEITRDNSEALRKKQGLCLGFRRLRISRLRVSVQLV